VWEDDVAKLAGQVEEMLVGHRVVMRGFTDDGRLAVAIVDRTPDAAVQEVRARWGDRVELRVGSVEFDFM
jgi:hypothetical protein